MTDSKTHNLLEIRLDGDAVGASRIPVDHLLRLLTNFNRALHRCAIVLQGEASSLKRGPRDARTKVEIDLDLVMLTRASPSVVLGFERKQSEGELIAPDFGLTIIEKAIVGLGEAQGPDEALPEGYDAGVLQAWRDTGVLLTKGVDQITFTLNDRETPIVTSYNREGFSRLQERIVGPQVNIRTIEGRLLMADFKEYGARCRIHPSVGEPVLCLFEEEQRDEVLGSICRYVKIIGEARENPDTGKITSVKIHDIERLEDREDEDAGLLPLGTPIPSDFWHSPTIDELAVAQGVQPMRSISDIFGTWPGDLNDGFEEDIQRQREESVVGGASS